MEGSSLPKRGPVSFGSLFVCLSNVSTLTAQLAGRSKWLSLSTYVFTCLINFMTTAHASHPGNIHHQAARSRGAFGYPVKLGGHLPFPRMLPEAPERVHPLLWAATNDLRKWWEVDSQLGLTLPFKWVQMGYSKCLWSTYHTSSRQ